MINSRDVLLVLAASLLIDVPMCANEDPAFFSAVAEGYASNRKSFASFTCRFKWTVGKCLSLEAAEAGELTDVIVHEGLWIVDGELCRYELVCDPAVMNQAVDRMMAEKRDTAKGGGHQILPCQEFFYLKNDQIRARQSKLLSSINLLTPDIKDDAGISVTPFSLGVMAADEMSSPWFFLDSVRQGRFKGRNDGVLEIAGRAVVSVSLGKEGERFRMGYHLDPERGYLPTRIWDSDPVTGKTYYEARILDVRDCGDGHWFPMRGIVIDGDPASEGSKTVKETRVVELSLEKPDRSMFFLDVPEGTQVTISGEKYYTNIKQDRKISEAELVALRDECISHFEAMVAQQQAGGAAPAVPQVPLQRSRWILIVNGLILCLAAAWFFWKRRRAAK